MMLIRPNPQHFAKSTRFFRKVHSSTKLNRSYTRVSSTALSNTFVMTLTSRYKDEKSLQYKCFNALSRH